MVDVDRLEVQVLEDLDGVVQPGHDGIAAAERQGAEAQGEDALAVGDAGDLVPGAHRQLIQVGQRRQAWPVYLRYVGHADSGLAIRDARHSSPRPVLSRRRV